jgi:hypothetical protein
MTWQSATGQYTGNVKNIAVTIKQSTGIDHPLTPHLSPLTSQLSPSTIYDLQGRKVSELKKGIYIINGKKIIIR